MAILLKSLLLLTSLPAMLPGVSAHMEMSWPIPFNSKFDSAYYGSSVDYSMTSPLRPDGSNFPCKGYHTEGKDKIQAQFVPGGTYNMTVAGSATHMGGSCQISLSYDNGQSFHVIRSMIGGCPLKPNWEFKIPDSAPSSQSVLFAWTWFNLVGNREMYMNCARVSVSNSPIPRYKRAVVNRQASLSSLPDMFACNIGNGCTTVERHEVVFPNPGSVVEYGQDAVTPTPGPGFVLAGPAPPGNAFSNTTSPTTGSNSTLPAPTGSYNYTTTRYANTSTMTTTSSTLSSLATTTSTSFSFTLIGGVFATVNTTGTTTTASVTNGTAVTTATMTTTTISPPYPMPNATMTVGPTGPTGTGTSGNIGTSTLTETSSSSDTTTTVSSLTTSDTATSSTSNSASTTAAVTSASASSTASSSSINSSNSQSATTTTSVTVTVSTTSSSATFSVTNVSGPCTPGAFVCNSATSFSQCVPNSAGTGTLVFLGSVAPGTECRNGAFVRAGSQPCTPVGALLCDGETAFRLCDIGGTVNMGPVAPGTRCLNGAIVAA